MFPIRDTAFSGAWDVVRKAFFALRMYRSALAGMRRFRPHLVLLVDYPGLNLRLAHAARSLGFPVCFVAPPQAWVYRRPARKLRRATEALRGCHVHVLFPFEAAAFAATAAGVSAGHFLATAGMRAPVPASAVLPTPHAAERNRLLLCPGSRLDVLRRNLPAWIALLARPDARNGIRTSAVPASPAAISLLVPEHLAAEARLLIGSVSAGPGALALPVIPDIRIRTDRESAFAEARHAIAFPGTITLELALARIPTLVMAILDPLTLALGRRLLGDSPLALPNLLAGEELFPEWAGLFPGPDAALFRKLERRRDRLFTGPADPVDPANGIPRWTVAMEKLTARMGPGTGAQVVCDLCSDLLQNRMRAAGAVSPRG
jgi:lipid-A-disaccharide synthase